MSPCTWLGQTSFPMPRLGHHMPLVLCITETWNRSQRTSFSLGSAASHSFRKIWRPSTPLTVKQVYENLEAIHEAKAKKVLGLNIVQKQIAFSRRGLTVLGLTEKTGDNRFDVFTPCETTRSFSATACHGTLSSKTQP